MLSCAAPAAAVMPSAQRVQWATSTHRTAHAPHLLHPPLKEEPIDTCSEAGAFTKEHGSGFLSEGFHSASPSSSSKDSHGHSPRSDRGSPVYYERPPSSELGLQLHFRAGLPYNLLTPPGLTAHDRRRLSPTYDARFSPEPRAAPTHASTPLPSAGTPPESPAAAISPDYFRDSGFHTSQRVKNESAAVTNGGEDGDTRSGDGASAGDPTEDADFDEEPGLRVPAVNSHGKVKTFKCKQCEFVAVTKLSFWEHTKEHIKPEKMLTCPKCPFVTEYKHHLEYHMRNHFGSKPFQCGQCSYSCVNKSMLNSHLKSHSNVYQYRCADCNYATKYCHSLKLHLRKYRHNPAMVLNPDGTPNPLPIIDVYGTRRGPKTKSLTKSLDDDPTPPPPQPPHPLFHNPFAVNFPYGSMLPHPFLFPPNNNYSEVKTGGRNSPLNVDPTLPPTILQQRLTYGDLPQEIPQPQRSLSAGLPTSSPSRRSPQRSPQRSPPPSPRTPPPQTPPTCSVATDALDLTSGKQSESSSPSPVQRSAPLTPTTAMKNRRKGRAFKLQPAALRLQHEDARPLDSETSGSESDASGGEATRVADTPPARHSPPAAAAALYDCPYCDISFKDLTMHTIHMGFHGYNDPFMCNKCGERSIDKVSFFIHLGRAEHA